jgi:UDPglucose 6-dehydrogenase/UDP-N-acetyl-D-galactosamine dehydrogenase
LVSKIIKKIGDGTAIICVVGLGYVGLPLAKAFSKYFQVVGYDIDRKKIAKLENKYREILFSSNPAELQKVDIIVVCVPTPVTKSKQPDLSYVKNVSETIGENLQKSQTVIFESTYFPGVTEDIVLPILESKSNLTCPADFKIGYSPERINPGDSTHNLENVVKVVSGVDEETLQVLETLYSKITAVYRAPNIKTAEAAKVIENIQRDLNIALINELTLIMHKMGLDIHEVIQAAETKWNFHKYYPGLVGGHCIPVDPYYLVYKAEELDYHPQIILSGRSINDYMPKYILEMTLKGLIDNNIKVKGSKCLLMGLTYKENVPDTRESPSKQIINELKAYGIDIYGHDPLLTSNEINNFKIKEYKWNYESKFDSIIIAVKHKQFLELSWSNITEKLRGIGLIIDVKNILTPPDKSKINYKKL